jgi:hypothetical protein
MFRCQPESVSALPARDQPVPEAPGSKPNGWSSFFFGFLPPRLREAAVGEVTGEAEPISDFGRLTRAAAGSGQLSL